MIRHHPSDETLLACAAGMLPAPHARVIATHLVQCRSCRASRQLGDEIGGALLEALSPVRLADDALRRALARLDEDPATEPETAASPILSEAAAQREFGGTWRWIAPGIRLMPLLARDESDTRLDLIRVAPGAALPRHGHRGFESTCVLQGGFADERGEYHVGDVAEGDRGFEHRPVALSGTDCICLIATTGRLLAHGVVARLAQRLVGV
jgi:putative transcriptional regulator